MCVDEAWGCKQRAKYVVLPSVSMKCFFISLYHILRRTLHHIFKRQFLSVCVSCVLRINNLVGSIATDSLRVYFRAAQILFQMSKSASVATNTKRSLWGCTRTPPHAHTHTRALRRVWRGPIVKSPCWRRRFMFPLGAAALPHRRRRFLLRLSRRRALLPALTRSGAVTRFTVNE